MLGIDLSLTATGLAYPSGGRTVVRPTTTGTARLTKIRAAVVAATVGADLVVLEGPAFGRAQQMHALGQLAGVVYCALDEPGRPPWMLVPPASLKRYATGRGNASKAEVLAEAIRRLSCSGHDDNEADAMWLRSLRSRPARLPGGPRPRSPPSRTRASLQPVVGRYTIAGDVPRSGSEHGPTSQS